MIYRADLGFRVSGSAQPDIFEYMGCKMVASNVV